MAGAKKRKQCQRRDARIGVPPCPAPVLAEHHLFLAGAKLIGIPSAVARLGGHQPVECGNHGRLGFCVATLALDQAKPIRKRCEANMCLRLQPRAA